MFAVIWRRRAFLIASCSDCSVSSFTPYKTLGVLLAINLDLVVCCIYRNIPLGLFFFVLVQRTINRIVLSLYVALASVVAVIIVFGNIALALGFVMNEFLW